MAKEDIRIYSRDAIKAMKAKGKVKKTPANAPTLKLSEAFWRKAHIVETQSRRKISVHLRLEPETVEFFRSAGRGHLTRMAKILKAYADTKSGHENRSRQ